MPPNQKPARLMRASIDVSDADECERWARELGLSAGDLLHVVSLVGNDVEAVQDHLEHRRAAIDPERMVRRKRFQPR